MGGFELGWELLIPRGTLAASLRVAIACPAAARGPLPTKLAAFLRPPVCHFIGA